MRKWNKILTEKACPAFAIGWSKKCSSAPAMRITFRNYKANQSGFMADERRCRRQGSHTGSLPTSELHFGMFGECGPMEHARITRRCRLFLWLPIRAMSSEDESRLRWKYLTLSDSLIGWIDRNYRDYLYSP